jgi:hypothetical protein
MGLGVRTLWPWVVEHWEFVVGTLVGLIGIVIAIATILYQRQPKQLDWEVRNDVQLISPHAGRQPGLTAPARIIGMRSQGRPRSPSSRARPATKASPGPHTPNVRPTS